MPNEFRANKYCGGVYCGNGEFATFAEALAFADDGFCDYVRIVAPDGRNFRIHFDPDDSKL